MENIYYVSVEESDPDAEPKTCLLYGVASGVHEASVKALKLTKLTEGMKVPQVTAVHRKGPRVF